MDTGLIIGIIVALLGIFIGLYILFTSYFNSSKDHPDDQALNLENDAGHPVIPRNKRKPIVSAQTADPQADTTDSKAADNWQDESMSISPAASQQTDADDEDGLSTLVNATEDILPMVETGEETQFNHNSPLLDQHLESQERLDQNSPLNHATANINVTLLPQQGQLSGKQLLNLLDRYGFKYGAMNMFHRYENMAGTGMLLFSMMRFTDSEGIGPFDLHGLADEWIDGLVFFLPLPHPQALKGFDTMMSISGLIARDLNASIFDDKRQLLDKARKDQLRQYVEDNYTADETTSEHKR